MLEKDKRDTGMALILAGMLLALLLLSLSSCSEDRADDAWLRAHGIPIRFGMAGQDRGEGTTRTAWGTLSLDGTVPGWSLRDCGFGVFACPTGTYRYASSTALPGLMWNQPVAYSTIDGAWAYSPLVYWPGTDGGPEEYVSFFAYGPWSNARDNAASASIVDFSLPSQTGDPWLLYQLAGSEDDWRSRQVDLVWAQVLDRTRPLSVLDPVELHFRHALACAGDVVTLSPTEECRTRLCALSARAGGPVSLTLTSLTLDYLLTAKGRLVLNSPGDQPNWQPVLSGNLMAHRRVLLSPGSKLGHAASAAPSQCTLAPYVTRDRGIFFLPLDLPGHPQQCTVTVGYSLSTGQTGVLSTVLPLAGARAGQQRDLSIHFTLPED